MTRSLVFLAISFWACAAGQPQSANDEIRLRATVQTVVLLTRFSGTIIPVDFDPRFALTLQIESAVPEVDRFRAGAVMALAIHSPSLTFREEPKEGKAYDFVLHRKIQDGKVRFFGLKVQKALER